MKTLEKYYVADLGLRYMLLGARGTDVGHMLENVFWFFRARFTILPVLLAVPVFAFLGWLIPSLMYGQATKQSIVERLREAE